MRSLVSFPIFFFWGSTRDWKCCVQIRTFTLLCVFPTSVCKRFEPRSHFISRRNMIVDRVTVILNRTIIVDSDWRSTTCAVVIFRSKMRIVETSVTVNNSPVEDCNQPEDHTPPTYHLLPVTIDLPADETSCWSSSSRSSHATGSVSSRCSVSMTVPALAITEKGQWVRLEIWITKNSFNCVKQLCQVVTLKEDVLSIPNGRCSNGNPDNTWTYSSLSYEWPLSGWVKSGMWPLRVSLIWNGVVKLSRLKKTFWAFQMGDDPMTLQIPDGHSCHWGMGGHCLEARAWVGLGISEYTRCEMVWSKYYI